MAKKDVQCQKRFWKIQKKIRFLYIALCIFYNTGCYPIITDILDRGKSVDSKICEKTVCSQLKLLPVGTTGKPIPLTIASKDFVKNFFRELYKMIAVVCFEELHSVENC